MSERFVSQVGIETIKALTLDWLSSMVKLPDKLLLVLLE